jgi:hypothetical protein
MHWWDSGRVSALIFLQNNYTDVVVEDDALYYPRDGCELHAWLPIDAP